MREIAKRIELFFSSNKIVSFEKKVFFWEELLYLFKNEKQVSSFLLMGDIIYILETMTSQVSSKLENVLNRKLNTFSKHLNKSKEELYRNLLALISESEKHLNEKNKVLIFNDVYFYSSEISNWAEEIYYLIEKLQEKDNFMESKSIFSLLRKARLILSQAESRNLMWYLKALKSSIEFKI